MIRVDSPVPLSLTTATAVTAGCAGIGFLALLPVEPSATVAAFVMTTVAGALSSVLLWGSHRAAGEEKVAGTQQPVLQNPTTGLAMPFLGDLMLAREFAAAQRGRPVTIALVKIDQIERYTSRHGRPMAERLLRSAARIVARQTRGMNLSAHHRGDPATYLLILSGTSLEGACVYVKRLRRELMSLPGFPEGIVVSAGIAGFDFDQSRPDDLLGHAERALAKASSAGGKIIVYGRTTSVVEA